MVTMIRTLRPSGRRAEQRVGVRAEQDFALMLRDGAAVEALLPREPVEYVQRFQNRFKTVPDVRLGAAERGQALRREQGLRVAQIVRRSAR